MSSYRTSLTKPTGHSVFLTGGLAVVVTRALALVLTVLLTGALALAGPADEARRWTKAKFLGQAEAGAVPAHVLVQLRAGALERNRIQDRAFLIAGTKYERGVALPSPGEVSVILPAPAARFEAVAGVDSNDLGYYSNGGRGSVVATVETGGQELFRSPVLHEGMAGVPVAVELHGVREFKLKLAAVGQHGGTWQGEWDQADWAEARVTLEDGTKLWLADLEQGPLAGAYTTDAPFSFRYDGRESAELLKGWRVERATRQLDAQRTEHVSIYTDPKTGLVVRAVAVAYADYPVVEWTVYLKNTTAAATPIIENLQALETQFERGGEGEFVLHHATGSPNSPTDFEPLTSVLGAEQSQRLASVGGRPTDGAMCYFNLEWAGQGVIIGLGWPGQWAAQFARDKQRAVRVTAGQERTHFRLLAGEEVRTPLVAMQFWEGDWIGAQNAWRRWMVAGRLDWRAERVAAVDGGVQFAATGRTIAAAAGVRGQRPPDHRDAGRDRGEPTGAAGAHAENGREDRLLVDGCGLVHVSKRLVEYGHVGPRSAAVSARFHAHLGGRARTRREDRGVVRTGARDRGLVAVGAPSGVVDRHERSRQVAVPGQRGGAAVAGGARQ